MSRLFHLSDQIMDWIVQPASQVQAGPRPTNQNTDRAGDVCTNLSRRYQFISLCEENRLNLNRKECFKIETKILRFKIPNFCFRSI